MNSGVSTILKTGKPHIQFNSNTSLPLNQHPENKGLCSYEVLLRALGDYSNDTPEENWVIKIPKKTPRCQPLLGVISPGISGVPTPGIIGT